MSRPPPTRETKPEPQARDQLHHYIHDFDPRDTVLPKRIEPGLVATVLHEELSKKRPETGPAQRIVALAVFYQTRSVVPDLLAHLHRTEQTQDDVLTSAALTCGVGYLGDRGQRDLGRGTFHHLLSLPLVENLMRVMVDVYEALTPDETSGILLGRLGELIDSFRAREDAGDQGAGTQRRILEGLANNTVRRLDLAVQIEQEILAREPDARMDALVDVYLGVDQRYGEHTRRWSVRTILRQAKELGDEAAVRAFRRALQRLGPRDEENELQRIRAILAIELFGGETTLEEREENAPRQTFFELTILE